MPEDRKLAKDLYKERKVSAGIYAVRCVPSGQIWVGQASNVDSVRNRLWFMLRGGNHQERSMQKAWSAYGADGFAFEILERVDEGEPHYIRRDRLSKLLVQWRDRLRAAPAN